MEKTTEQRNGAMTARVAGASSLSIEQRAEKSLHWQFTVPADGRVPEQTFRFAFPRALTEHTTQTLPIRLGPDGPDPNKRCLKLTGEPDGAFNTAFRPTCAD